MNKAGFSLYQIIMRASVVALIVLFITTGLLVDTVHVSGTSRNYGNEAGIYTVKSFKNEEVATGVNFDHVLLFQTVQHLDFSKIKPYLDDNKQVILNIEFVDDHANLAEVAGGDYDKYLKPFANTLKKDGRTIWIRPLHEFNGDWYNWGVYYQGNNIQDFIPAYRHVVSVFRNGGVHAKFQLNYNRYNGGYPASTTPFQDFYPGDAWVDMVVITNYNRAYTDSGHQYWHSFADDFKPAYDQVVKLTKKPIGVAEMSTTSYGGNKPQWILDAFRALRDQFPQVQQITWFAYNRPVNASLWDWDLNSPADNQAFRDGVALWRKGPVHKAAATPTVKTYQIVPAKSAGAKGDTGATGSQGAEGTTGPTGPQGIAGVAGVRGLIGLTGANGTNGLPGSAGTAGSPGPSGLSSIALLHGDVTSASPLNIDTTIPVDAVNAQYGTFQQVVTAPVTGYNPHDQIAQFNEWSVALVDTTKHAYNVGINIVVCDTNRNNCITIAGWAHANHSVLNDAATLTPQDLSIQSSIGSGLSYDASTGKIASSDSYGGDFSVVIDYVGTLS